MKAFKKIVLFSLVIFGVVLASSCKRCATCTFDDEVFGQDTSDFCGSGNTYRDQLDQHENNGWKCVED